MYDAERFHIIYSSIRTTKLDIFYSLFFHKSSASSFDSSLLNNIFHIIILVDKLHCLHFKSANNTRNQVWMDLYHLALWATRIILVKLNYIRKLKYIRIFIYRVYSDRQLLSHRRKKGFDRLWFIRPTLACIIRIYVSRKSGTLLKC